MRGFKWAITTQISNKESTLRQCGKRAYFKDKVKSALENGFVLDGATFTKTNTSIFSTSDVPSVYNLQEFLRGNQSRNPHDSSFVSVGVNLHQAYLDALKGSSNIPLSINYGTSNLMNLTINLQSNGSWNVSCR